MAKSGDLKEKSAKYRFITVGRMVYQKIIPSHLMRQIFLKKTVTISSGILLVMEMTD